MALVALAGSAEAQNRLTTVRLTTGLTRPVFVTAPPGDFQRLFIVEQRGSAGVATRADIKILNKSTNTVNATPFLSITGLSTGSEQGLLGLAFDPNYASNGFFYVDYTNSAGATVVARYQVSADPNVANPAGTTVLTQAQPFANHNGGWLGFGPDGYLYISFGDGGSQCDPGRRAQNLTNVFGKLLRISVATLPYTIPPSNPFFGSTVNRQEIWAYGLRNPWRPSFDRETGDLWIADVGQDTNEEIDFQPAAIVPPFTAVNYGWSCREGFDCASVSLCPVTDCPAGCVSSGFKDPVYAYPHPGTSNCSISGGYAYRGRAVPELRGEYFFADYCSGFIKSLRFNGSTVTGVTDRTAELNVAGTPISGVVSFGEDNEGEMYIVAQGSGASTGSIFKIVPRCAANCDGSTASPILNVNDFQCFLNKFASGDPYANCDGSTIAPVLNVNDFICFQNLYATSSCP
jgi:glucose/arabinose dehydrogenase